MKTLTPPPTFKWPVRIYWEDTDAGGIVYYANYLKFMERARSEWLRALKVDQAQLALDHVLFVVKSVSVEYHRSAKLDDALDTSVVVERINRASIELYQAVCRGNEILVDGHIKIATIDGLKSRPVAIPEAVRNSLHSAHPFSPVGSTRL